MAFVMLMQQPTLSRVALVTNHNYEATKLQICETTASDIFSSLLLKIGLELKTKRHLFFCSVQMPFIL